MCRLRSFRLPKGRIFSLSGVLVGITGIIVAIWLHFCDFGIYINPPQGEVISGQATGTVVSVASYWFFRNPVTLKIDGPGINSALYPLMQGIPPFNTALVLQPDPDDPLNVFASYNEVKQREITISVSDGSKEKRLTYLLRIKAPTIPLVTIDEPAAGSLVSSQEVIKGTFSGVLMPDQYVWVMVGTHSSPGLQPDNWWPQGNGRIYPPINDKNWDVIGRFGGGPDKDAGLNCDIAVIVVDKDDDDVFTDWVITGWKTGNYPGFTKLPPGAEILKEISVRRK